MVKWKWKSKECHGFASQYLAIDAKYLMLLSYILFMSFVKYFYVVYKARRRCHSMSVCVCVCLGLLWMDLCCP